MQAVAACAILTLAACHHGSARPVAPPAAPILVVQQSGSVFAVDAATSTAAVVPDLERLGRLDLAHAIQHGPYVTFSHDDIPDVLDLRISDVVSDDELRTLVDDAVAISLEGDTAFVTEIDAGLHVRVAPPRSAPDGAWTIRRPAPELVSIVVSPDGATLAVVGAGGEAGAPQDLYTIRLPDGETADWSAAGDVLDVRFVDDDHVLFAHGEDDDFHVLDLETGEIERLQVPAGWAAEGFDGDTAPLVPIRDERDARALLDPRSGSVYELAYGDELVAVAPDGASIVVAQECHVPGGLTRRFASGDVEELRRPLPDEACKRDPFDDESARLASSAAFSSDGRYLVLAAPHGSGWRVTVEDATRARRTVLDSPTLVRVFGWR